MSHPEHAMLPPLQGYKRFGFTREGGATVYREWAPAATAAQLIGDFNGWAGAPMQGNASGVWSITLPDGALTRPPIQQGRSRVCSLSRVHMEAKSVAGLVCHKRRACKAV